jgi:hypothetical protein
MGGLKYPKELSYPIQIVMQKTLNMDLLSNPDSIYNNQTQPKLIEQKEKALRQNMHIPWSA